MSSKKFDTLSFSRELVEHLERIHFLEMTPIQAKALPQIIDNKDLLASSKTGSGKTAAFSLVSLEHIDISSMTPQMLVLCPTRELANQIAENIRLLGQYKSNLKVALVTGGSNEKAQIKALEYGCHILVATPGRLLKILRENDLDFKHIKTFVLDEADRMLEMGFIEDVYRIEVLLPEKRQNLFFSATLPDEIKKLSQDFQTDPVLVEVDNFHDQNSIKEIFVEVLDNAFDVALFKIYSHYQYESTIIFCKTKIQCEELKTYLINKGISADTIHGDLDQRDRTRVLAKFENGSLLTLIATDVAARGLDIPHVDMVMNYFLPPKLETYIHRKGRTGRADKKGIVVNFFPEYKRNQIFEQFNINETNLTRLESFSINKNVAKPKFQTFYISGGKKDKVRKGDIVGALVGELKISPDDIGVIKLHPMFSYVAIAISSQLDIKTKLSLRIKKRNFKIGLVK